MREMTPLLAGHGGKEETRSSLPLLGVGGGSCRSDPAAPPCKKNKGLGNSSTC
jgi:hypothetical protein